jgi:hypothetical protein
LTPELERTLNEISAKPAFFVFWGGGQKGWVKDMENARLSFVFVVQANKSLFDKAEAEWAPGVFLSTTAPEAADAAWMERMGGEIAGRLHNNEFPEAAAYLAAEDSTFSLDLPAASTQGVPFKLWTTYVDPERLPEGFIPESRVLPALLHGGEWTLLPRKLYA